MRAEVIASVADLLTRTAVGHPLRVGIDGVCGVGKSTFARDLVEALGPQGVHLDSDGFHHLRAVRRRNTTDPARGYYDDAYDLEALTEQVLEPLGADGPYRIPARIHDLGTDEIITDEWIDVAPDAIVVFDCTFLQRDQLRRHWDEVIFLDAPVQVSTDRGIARDRDAMGGEDAARDLYASRYRAACEIYLAEQSPRERASMVIDHADPQAPSISRDRAASSDVR